MLVWDGVRARVRVRIRVRVRVRVRVRGSGLFLLAFFVFQTFKICLKRASEVNLGNGFVDEVPFTFPRSRPRRRDHRRH